MTEAPNTHCVVYRIGGTDNFKWLHSLAMSKTEAYNMRDSMVKMGYKTLIYKWSDLMTIGMPETY